LSASRRFSVGRPFYVIPAPSCVIPAFSCVIPANAGI
jgi:hypothetical protein